MFIIELTPPADYSELQKYYDKISKLLEQTNRVSIASKPSSSPPLGGFEKSVRLVGFLRSVRPNLDILFHVTCRDLNKLNIKHKLNQLRELDIDKLLVVTGDNYERPEADQSAYGNSVELVEAIGGQFNWLGSIAVGGYPGGNGRQSHDNKAECQRLARAVQVGASSVLTQCVFDLHLFDEFRRTMSEVFGEKVEVIPSVALFTGKRDLERVLGLTRFRGSQLAGLGGHFSALDDTKLSETFCFDHLLNLCEGLAKRSRSIVICPFGRFQLANSLIGKLMDINQRNE